MSNTESNIKYFQQHANTSLSHSFQIDSGLPGPHLVFVGALHGSEPASVEAMIDFHKYFTKNNHALKHGKITFIIGNPEAYAQNLRFIDINMNRVFTDNILPNSVEERRAIEVMKFLKENKDISFLLDMHSVSVGNFQAVIYASDEKSKDLSTKITNIKLHFSTEETHTPGLIVSVANQLNIPSLAIECGNNTASSTVNVALEHVVMAINHFNLMDQEKLPIIEVVETDNQDVIEVYKFIAPIKPGINFKFIVDDVKTGTKVKSGQIFATDDIQKHVAPIDCYIIMPDKNPKLGDHDAGFLAIKEVIKMSS